LEFLGQVLLQLLFGAFEALFHLLAERLFASSRNTWPRLGERAVHPLLAAIGFIALGVAFGVIGAWLVPVFLTPSRGWQVINLGLVPIAVGLMVEVIRRRKLAAGLSTSLFDRYECAGLFAFSALLTRFILLDQA
jgi:hypothetical protein